MELNTAERSVAHRSIPDPIIHVNGLGKRFFLSPDQRPGSWLDATLRTIAGRIRGAGKRIVAVDDVGLQVRRGEIVGLLGPNGAGKTTLIKMLCGLLVPSTGSGHVLGFDLRREDRLIRANVSLVAPTADVGTDNNLTVRQNLEFWAFVYDVPRADRAARIDELLAVVDLIEAQDAWPMRISAGMRQRLAIARALLARNPLLFLDEPTVKLDPAAARRIRAFVADLRVRYGLTIVLTTHYMFEAEELCDRIVIMDRGRIIAQDTPANLKRLLGADRQVVVEASEMGAEIVEAVRRLPGVRAADVESGTRLIVRADDADAATGPLLGLLRRSGVRVRAVKTTVPTLEDVFFHLADRGQL
jgi:ABC-2 type transport system ATP-binding protein